MMMVINPGPKPDVKTGKTKVVTMEYHKRACGEAFLSGCIAGGFLCLLAGVLLKTFF